MGKEPCQWKQEHTEAIKRIKKKVKILPTLHIIDKDLPKIIESNASDTGWGGILKQVRKKERKFEEESVKFASGTWTKAEQNYATIDKEILIALRCIEKFQIHLLNHDFVIRTNCSSLPFVLNNNIKNATSKGKFVRWQELFSCYNYTIENISENKIAVQIS